jgi:hypothetical protein
MTTTRTQLRRSMYAAAAAIALLPLAPGGAHAHFVLRAPACYSEQDDLGLPLKSAPCGQADATPVVETGEVTDFVAGQTITVTVEEMVFHPGHYRIAIAPDMGSLPDDPPVTADSRSPCGSTVIDGSPELPLLADGVLMHTTRYTGPQSVEVTLPPDFTCDHCVLQVIEFMSNHGLNVPGGCFYHHCANVTVQAASDTDGGAMMSTDGGAVSRDGGGASFDGGSSSGADGSTGAVPDGGCACRASGPTRSTPSSAAACLLVVASIALRRRGRR